MNVDKYKQNHKTAYLAESYERLLKEEQDIRDVLASDPSMNELAKKDLATLDEQKAALRNQMDSLLKEEADEEAYPGELVLEVRAGVGGEEAALFAKKLARLLHGLLPGSARPAAA